MGDRERRQRETVQWWIWVLIVLGLP